MKKATTFLESPFRAGSKFKLVKTYFFHQYVDKSSIKLYVTILEPFLNQLEWLITRNKHDTTHEKGHNVSGKPI